LVLSDEFTSCRSKPPVFLAEQLVLLAAKTVDDLGDTSLSLVLEADKLFTHVRSHACHCFFQLTPVVAE
jgi:hypothetical protein